MRVIVVFFTFLLCNGVIASSAHWSGICIINDGIYTDNIGDCGLLGDVSNAEGNRADIISIFFVHDVVGNELVFLFSKHLGQKNGETWQRYWGPMLPFRLDAIQHKIDQWEGDDASQYQIETFDLSSFGEIVNER